MIGYLHFRFKEAYLFSCAPDGTEYIFNARPKHQLEITQERLNEWYEVMFREAEKRSIVQNVQYGETDKTRSVSFCFSSHLCRYDLFLRDPS